MSNKLDKRTNCEYCGKDLDAKYRSKRFCDAKCRIYWNRENKKPLTTVAVIKEVAKRMGKEAVAVNSDLPLNEPKENTMAFYLKYDCYTWAEVNDKKDKK